MTTPEYHLSLIVGRSTLQLHGAPEPHGSHLPQERFFSVVLDGDERGRISLFSFLRPDVAIHEPFVFIWGGVRLFRLDTDSGALFQCLEHDDEVRAVYPLGARWCVVGEISVVVFDSDFASKRQVHSLDEIVLESWWRDGKLHIKDLQGREIQFEPSGPRNETLEPA